MLGLCSARHRARSDRAVAAGEGAWRHGRSAKGTLRKLIISGYYGSATAVMKRCFVDRDGAPGGSRGGRRGDRTGRPVRRSGLDAVGARRRGRAPDAARRGAADAARLRRADQRRRQPAAGRDEPKTIPYYTGIIGLARLLGKPVFVYAQGIGPVKRAWLRPLVRAAINASRIVTVRDEESAALLARFGVARGRIGVVPDPVMGAPRGEARAHIWKRHRPIQRLNHLRRRRGLLRASRGTPTPGHITPAVVSASSTPPLIGVSVRFLE